MTLPWRSNSPTDGSSRRAGGARSFDARPGSSTWRSSCATAALVSRTWRGTASSRNPREASPRIHEASRATDEAILHPTQAHSPSSSGISYIAAGDLGFWQAALRDPTVELYTTMSGAIASLGRVTIDLLYGDIEGGQSTITRFVLLPSEPGKWRYDVTHHWRLADGKQAGPSLGRRASRNA